MKKYENFCNSFKNLKDIYDYNEPYSNVEMSGLVALYEICFEQSWKAMKEILEQQGFAEERTGSPKNVLKTAFSAGMIDDEELWMAALNARNNVAHSYNKEIALDIINQTKHRFYNMFEKLKMEIDTRWISE